MSELDYLNSKFAISGHIDFLEGKGGLIRARINNTFASVEITLQGAHLISWQPHGEAPVIWLSENARFEEGKGIRGGIPICWPWFGLHETDSTLPAHGFVRTAMWQVASTETLSDGATSITLTLSSSPATQAIWPHDFKLDYIVTVGHELELELKTENTGSHSFEITEALHTYFAIGDIDKIKINGLAGRTYADKVDGMTRKVEPGKVHILSEVDRIYLDTDGKCQIEDLQQQRMIEITAESSRAIVVWNPWMAKAEKMGDMGKDGYRTMVCVESANALEHSVNVSPGKPHRLIAGYAVKHHTAKIKIDIAKRNSRIAIIAIALFILFDITALALTYWLSYQIEQQAVAINLAGRQRMLSQRMVKVLLQIDDALEHGQNTQEQLKELKLTYDLFDNTLQGFNVGHQTRGGADEGLFLPAVKGEKARAAVDEAVTLWIPYREHILQVLTASQSLNDDVLRPAIAHAYDENIHLLKLMNNLTTALELQTKTEAENIRIYQGIAFALALISFFWALVAYIQRIREFSRNHNLLNEIINKISASVLILNNDAILQANQTAEQLFGYKNGGLVGQKFDKLLTGNEEKLIGHRKDGSTFMASRECDTVMFDQQELDIVTVLDITQQRQTEDHLSSLAYHDLLTRLPNRLLFDDRLRMEIIHCQRNGLMLAVLFIDLDKFKPVNDTYGHEVGDLLLQDVAIRLRRCLRESDTVSRRGGDEFTIIASDSGSLENCEKIARIVLTQLTNPFHIQDIEINISCSIGISIFPKDGADAHLLISRADEAMYQAKNAGRGTYCFYSPTTSPTSETTS